MSTAHISEELPRLLTGEASRDAVLDAAEHLRGCPDCQQDLVSAVVAHASLTSAHRFAPEVVNPPSDEHPEIASVTALPDLSSIFAQARQEAEVTAARPGRRRRLALVSVAAAAVIAAGSVAITQIGDSSSPAPTAESVALVSSVSGKPAVATIVGPDHMRIDATSLPPLDSQHQYEVWLTSSNTADHPQSIGFIDSDRKADLRVPAKIMSQYSVIAVSRQGLHQTEYSGHLVLFGSYRD